MATALAEDVLLPIGDVARTVGLRASAIRYYEDAGLLPRAARVGGKRRYQPDAIDRLLLIRFCQRLGFTLSDIRRILTDPSGRRPKYLWRQLVDFKLGEIDTLIASAKNVRRVLRESRDCDCLTLSSCRFLRQELATLSPTSSTIRPAIQGRRHADSKIKLGG